MKLSLTCCLLVILGPLYAQLNWWLKPIVETENFRFNVNTPDFIIVTPEKDKFGILQRNGKYLYEPGTLKFADYNEGNA